MAVTAGVPCLRHFAAAQAGPVLMYAAEDAGHIVRSRLEGIARAAGTPFDMLDIAVIDAPCSASTIVPIGSASRRPCSV